VKRRIVLVTGTDTGVGKTWVACGLARALRAAGLSVAVRKPAETGCGEAPVSADSIAHRAGVSVARSLVGAHLRPADAAALRDAAGGTERLDEVCPYRFAEPLAPAVAARRAGVTIDVAALVRDCRERAASADVLLVEGAGGLLVPLGDGATFADLARELAAAVIVVVGARLGAINHALLTIEAARARGLSVLGLVVNHFSATRDLATETLAETLAELGDVPLLATVSFRDDGTAALAELARSLAA
jgi:dethiobiotin synthetase